MRDLTEGSITRHLFSMAAFIAVGLIVQTLYFLVDLYFVSHLGRDAVAGVSGAGISTFVVMAATQLIAVGALALISQAIGRKDEADAQLIVDQALSLSLLGAAAVLAIGYTLGIAGVGKLGADPATGLLAQTYLAAFLPSLALMFPMAAMGSALRASGVAGPPMLIQSATVLVNAILAPVLIAGWGTRHPLGVAGAGLASTVAALVGVVAFAVLFGRMQTRLALRWTRLKPIAAVWRRLFAVGLPAAAEFSLMFIVMGVIFVVIRPFGAEAQAGFGIGMRVMQSIFLPAMAVAFAAAPIAGQNFGARKADRVRATFRGAAIIGSAIMLVLTLLCQIAPAALVGPFTSDAAVIAVAADYLRFTSWNFVANGLIFACSGMFQAFGDTKPALISGAGRLLTFVAPAIALSFMPGVTLHDYWRLSVASVALQAVTSVLLLRVHMRRKLDFEDMPTAAPQLA